MRRNTCIKRKRFLARIVRVSFFDSLVRLTKSVRKALTVTYGDKRSAVIVSTSETPASCQSQFGTQDLAQGRCGSPRHSNDNGSSTGLFEQQTSLHSWSRTKRECYQFGPHDGICTVGTSFLVFPSLGRQAPASRFFFYILTLK